MIEERDIKESNVSSGHAQKLLCLFLPPPPRKSAPDMYILHYSRIILVYYCKCFNLIIYIYFVDSTLLYLQNFFTLHMLKLLHHY